MKSVKEVTELTGVSARTLQYYDEIGILKPSRKTSAGYRLYDEDDLQRLQQVLFYKELGFKLQDISELMGKSDYDKIAAYRSQKEMFLLKRNRIDRLIQLLDQLEKGEKCMSFKEFDLSDYIQALKEFKEQNKEVVARHWGSLENFDLFVSQIEKDEASVAKMAIQGYGSVEKYTEAMKHNLEHFDEIMESKMTDDVKETMRKSAIIFSKLLSDMTRDPKSQEVQDIVKEWDEFMIENVQEVDLADRWEAIICSYSTSEFQRKMTDAQYGEGASDYIVSAVKCYRDCGEKSY